MNLRYHKSFQKDFAKLAPKQRLAVQNAVFLFEADPQHPSLRNHPLKGSWGGHRSISAGGDLRVHFLMADDQTAVFVAVGTHSQLYK